MLHGKIEPVGDAHGKEPVGVWPHCSWSVDAAHQMLHAHWSIRWAIGREGITVMPVKCYVVHACERAFTW